MQLEQNLFNVQVTATKKEDTNMSRYDVVIMSVSILSQFVISGMSAFETTYSFKSWNNYPKIVFSFIF